MQSVDASYTNGVESLLSSGLVQMCYTCKMSTTASASATSSVSSEVSFICLAELVHRVNHALTYFTNKF